MKLYVKTHGCQMNEYDSARMADLLAESDSAALVDAPGRRGCAPAQHLLHSREGAGEGVS